MGAKECKRKYAKEVQKSVKIAKQPDLKQPVWELPILELHFYRTQDHLEQKTKGTEPTGHNALLLYHSNALLARSCVCAMPHPTVHLDSTSRNNWAIPPMRQAPSNFAIASLQALHKIKHIATTVHLIGIHREREREQTFN